MKIYEVAVVGAGASGLMATLKASENEKSVVLVEANLKLGKKLLATGNGRCNIANENINIKKFHGDNKSIKDLIIKYPCEIIMDEFEKIGVYTVADNEGRLYPKSMQAAQVLKALSDALSEKSVTLYTEFKVINVKKEKNLFVLEDENNLSFACKKFIIACGGKASPKHSGALNGYDIAKKLGHTVTKTMPALTKFNCDDKCIKALSGVKAKCNASLYDGNNFIYSEKGEMIFSDKALSGICLFNLSVYANEYFAKGKKLQTEFDFAVDVSEQELFEKITSLKENRPLMNSGDLLNGFINMKLGFSIIKKCGIDSMLPIKELKNEQIKKIIKQVKYFRLEVSQNNQWDSAQVTDGGVPLSEIDLDTMQSKKCPSLYFAGEILNIHGDCGGYNLYWAWLTGMISGESASRKVIRI